MASSACALVYGEKKCFVVGTVPGLAKFAFELPVLPFPLLQQSRHHPETTILTSGVNVGMHATIMIRYCSIAIQITRLTVSHG
jgi:hypothetical protein